jgi:hypothetical protein
MSKTIEIAIHKYKLKNDYGKQVVQMPKGAMILRVAFQDREIYVWARVLVEVELADYTFEVVATGQKLSTTQMGVYVGTLHDEERGLVYHVFYKSWV